MPQPTPPTAWPSAGPEPAPPLGASAGARTGGAAARGSSAPLAGWLALLALALIVVGLGAGSAGWAWPQGGLGQTLLWDIRLPRTLGAWLAGALLGLSGALAQGLFRNPLADPYLLGSAAGAGLGVAVWLSVWGLNAVPLAWALRLGLTGAAFVGALAAVMLTLALARGVQHTLRLLLAGVVVGVVLGAISALLGLIWPDTLAALQAFMWGSTAWVGWSGVVLMATAGVLCGALALVLARVLDGLALGPATARSLGLPLARARLALIAALALASATAVAQTGLIAFVGLVAPHLVRARASGSHRALVWLSALSGGALLLAADVLARVLMAPQELPVGVFTAVLGGGYLLWLMHQRRA